MPPRPTPPDERVVLELFRVSKRFAAGVPGCCAEVRALDAVSWRVRSGELAVVEGGAGSGKTTLLLCASGLLRLDGGSVRVREGPLGESVRYVARRTVPGDGGVRHERRSRLKARRRSRRPTNLLDEMEALGGVSTRIREARAVMATHVTPLSRIAYAVTQRPSVLLLDLEDGEAGALRGGLVSVVERLTADGVAVVVATRQASDLHLDAANVLTLRCGSVERARHATSRRKRDSGSCYRRKRLGDARR